MTEMEYIKSELIAMRCPEFFDCVKDGYEEKFDSHIKSIISRINSESRKLGEALLEIEELKQALLELGATPAEARAGAVMSKAKTNEIKKLRVAIFKCQMVIKDLMYSDEDGDYSLACRRGKEAIDLCERILK